MKPIIKYRGGKSKELCNFLQYIPDDYTRYVEPFAGGAALFFHLEPERALINDINTRLISFYSTIRDNFELTKKRIDCLRNQVSFKSSRIRSIKEKTVIIYRKQERSIVLSSPRYVQW